MKKNILVFGLISGLIVTGFMVFGTLSCYNDPAGFKSSMVIGYAAMLLAFSFIFVGIKNFRDKYNDGVITFGKAFQIGFYIALISSTMYVAVWLVEFYFFIPDFMEKYTTHLLTSAKASGANQMELEKQVAEMAGYTEMYKNPLFVVLLSYAEVFPLGLIITLLCALILKRKPKDNNLENTN